MSYSFIAAILHQSVLPKLFVGTAVNQATQQAIVPMRVSAIHVVRLVILLETAQILIYLLVTRGCAIIALSKVTLQPIAQMKWHAKTADRQGILPGNVQMALFATCAIYLGM